jgi:methionyl-tRNA formyltransferase
VAVAYGQLIPGGLLRLPRHGMLGVHPSLLPKYRGAAPVAWAILNGETVTGVTIFQLTERLDAGAIMSRQVTPIDPGETAERLTQRLAQVGAEELLRALKALADGRARVEPQEESQASLAPKLTKAQGTIAWERPAEAIERLVRATQPWPGASTTWQGHSFKIFAASVNTTGVPTETAPGTVLDVSSEAIRVATGQGALAIREVQMAGKRRMSVKEFLAGHRIQVGDILGVISD